MFAAGFPLSGLRLKGTLALQPRWASLISVPRLPAPDDTYTVAPPRAHQATVAHLAAGIHLLTATKTHMAVQEIKRHLRLTYKAPWRISTRKRGMIRATRTAKSQNLHPNDSSSSLTPVCPNNLGHLIKQANRSGLP